MCYQKFHTCRYCNNQYPCDLDNYTCPTLNHDEDMDMCLACKKRLEDKLSEIDLNETDINEIDFDELLRDDE